ncbi:prolyl oligopeptidase family serine peptidase, partial [Acinetobacter baumannii]
ENGGIFAVANIRGGGEYGEKWHVAGTKLNKQNVFDDFRAAAAYLVSNKYTSKEKLAIQGESNGGLLIGATITQDPGICKVAFPFVGVMD